MPTGIITSRRLQLLVMTTVGIVCPAHAALYVYAHIAAASDAVGDLRLRVLGYRVNLAFPVLP